MVLEIGAGSGLLSIIAERARDRERDTYLGLYPRLPRLLIHHTGTGFTLNPKCNPAPEVNDYLYLLLVVVVVVVVVVSCSSSRTREQDECIRSEGLRVLFQVVLEIGAGSGLLSIIAERDRERDTHLGLYPQLPRLTNRHGNRIHAPEV